MHNQGSSKLSFRQISAPLFAAVLGLLWSGPCAANAAQAAPTSIRVGTGCSCKTCPTVVTVSMETYVKRVLPSEWIASWKAESLKAGAVAIRSYGAYHVYNPIAATYDICDTTCCQKYTITQYASSDNAVDATKGIYLIDAAGKICRSEYCAEGNDSANRDGCGNGYIISNPSDGVCLSDSVCSGYTQNGHGRGMCQWGSQRWATSGKTYTWIVDHYYASYNWTRANLNPTSAASVIVDNSTSGFAASSNWSTGTAATDKYGTNYRYRSTASVSDAAQWTANIASAGNYIVYAWWSAGTNRSATAPYVLPNNTTVYKNQQTGGGGWQVLGSVSLGTGNAVTKLSCWTTTGYVVLADAIKYVK